MTVAALWPRPASVVLLCAFGASGCGRLGYDLLSPVEAGQPGAGGTSTGGRGGAAGLAGAGGVAGAAGGAGGGGVGGAAAAAGAGGAGGRPAIVCHPASHAGHAYQFCDAVVDWATARVACEGAGLRLVRVDDTSENTWLMMTATSAPISFRRSNTLWIGGHEPTTDGNWRWTDGDAFWLGGATAAGGAPIGGLYSNWNPTEPDNSTGPESCAAIPLNGMTWIDDRCAALQYFACEAYP